MNELDAAIIREAAEVLAAVGTSGVPLPSNWRWPLIDELGGIAMLTAGPEREGGECGACGDGCKDRGACRLAEESPQAGPALLYEHPDDGTKVYGYATPQSAPGVRLPPPRSYPKPDPATGADTGPCCAHAHADGWNECRRAMQALLASGQSAAGEGWQPIATCPYWKRVLLLMPEMESYASCAWVGQRVGGDSRNCGYDEGWQIPVPQSLPPRSEYPSGPRRQLWISEMPTPLGWQPLPAAPAAQAKEEGRG